MDLGKAVVNYDETIGGIAELWVNRDRVDAGDLASQLVDDYLNSSSYDQGRGFGKTVLATAATAGAGPAIQGSRAAVAAGEAGTVLRATVAGLDAVQGAATAARARMLAGLANSRAAGLAQPLSLPGAGSLAAGAARLTERARDFAATKFGMGFSREARRVSDNYFRRVGARLAGRSPRPTRQHRFSSGQVFEETLDVSHEFLPNRWRFIPMQIRHHRLNLKPRFKLDHARIDPHAYQFLPKWVKDAIKTDGLF